MWLDSAGVLAGILVAIVLLLACEGLYYQDVYKRQVLSAQAVENLKKARETLGERAKILAGILPVVLSLIHI